GTGSTSRTIAEVEEALNTNSLRPELLSKTGGGQHHFLATLVDYYFYIDISVDALDFEQEYIIPFPRITFGYFFDHPFLVTNHNLNQSRTVSMVISRISSHKITVQSQSDRIKIIGAHVRPYTLAYLTQKPISSFPWLIDTEELFGDTAKRFRQKIDQCTDPEQMFDAVEKVFLDTLLTRDLSTITQAVDLIEQRSGDIKLTEVAQQLNVSERTLRNQFSANVGCTPKGYLQLVKLKKSVYDMRFSDHSLTDITYDSHYFDQAHFINSVKRITGKSPKKLRKELPSFRFLQF
ncbi:MAG: helix-turn-helix transcriptional regulator, partial [Bacteroidota bacterium]